MAQRLTKETYIRPSGGEIAGGGYADITAVKNGKTIHINTADTYANGSFTAREINNAARMRADSGQHVFMISKVK